ncbi:Pentatricopeptide repeat [Dillenia turbinata]|uniref:Pentatricopeptide repeat n=1 Tax=Dillenia turbinata TaxID=194707 RepID=A0AAN8ZRV7_9MAGN
MRVGFRDTKRCFEPEQLGDFRKKIARVIDIIHSNGFCALEVSNKVKTSRFASYMAAKRLLKATSKSLQRSSPLSPSLPTSPAFTIPLPTVSLPVALPSNFQRFISSHLKPSFTPQDLLHFLQKKLCHHPHFSHLDIHIFLWASRFDFFRHDHSTYKWMIQTLAISNRFHELRTLLDLMVSNPCPCSDGIFSCPHSESTFKFAINSYCRVGRLDEALYAFELTKRSIDGRPSVVLYNTLISGFVRHREHERALNVYNQMAKDRVKPDVFTYNILISSYCRNSQFESGLKLFKEMRIKGCEPNVVTFNTLINGLFKEKRLEEGIGMAYEMLDLGCDLSSVTCEILVDGLCREQRVSEACDLLLDFSREGALPNAFDCFGLVERLCKEGDIVRALEVVDELWAKGNIPSLIACTTLVEGLRGAGKMKEAYKLTEKMLKQGILLDSVTYNCILKDLCDAGRPVEANNLRLLASTKGLDADGMTYNILISGYARKGQRHEGEGLVNEMLDRGFIPDLATYNRLMDKLANGSCLHPNLHFIDG